MMKIISTSWIVFCFALLGGCILQPTKPTTAEKTPVREAPIVAMPTPDSVETLLKFAQAYVALPAEAQKREYMRLTGQRKTEISRMQLALIASLAGSRYRDAARAQVLLDEHLKTTSDKNDGVSILARLMKSQLSDEQRLEDNVSMLEQKLKEEQKKSETLQRKLDELLAVEKTMNERKPGQRK